MHIPTPPRRRGRRLASAVAAVALTGGLVGAMAGPASAHQVCNSGTGYVTCFSTTPIGNRDHAIHIGIDVHMSQADADAILGAPGDEFTAKIWADDPVYDNALFSMPLTWAASGPDGLAAEFDIVVDGEVIDEDDGFFEGRIDEIYAVVALRDPRTGAVRSFTTAIEQHYF